MRTRSTAAALLIGCLAATSLVRAADAPASTTAATYSLKPGPQLFVDNFLLDRVEGVTRRVIQPQRFLDRPIITAAGGHKNWQPWLTVLHDAARPAESRFRMWYCADVIDDVADQAYETKIAYLESADGVHWPATPRYVEGASAVLFGASVIDDGPTFTPAEERFKLLYYRTPNDNSLWNGPAVGFSPDGLQWTLHEQGKPIIKPSAGGDSWHAAYDPIHKRYLLVGKSNEIHEWTNAEGQALKKRLRLFGTAVSQDFKHWSELQMWFAPDEKDPGVTEGYAVTGYMARGDLILAFLQILRDDLTAEGAPREAVAANERLRRTGAGMGHTVLCWSRDGVTWQRDRHTDPFLLPAPKIGAWDHAMAWAASAVPVDDQVLVYYGGYRWGHKYKRSEDRQVGVVKVARDRFVAREAGDKEGILTTKPLTIDCDALSLNVAASRGEVRVQVCDVAGQPLPGFTFAESRAVKGDALDAPVAWQSAELKLLRGKTVRLQFALRNAQLFALNAR